MDSRQLAEDCLMTSGLTALCIWVHLASSPFTSDAVSQRILTFTSLIWAYQTHLESLKTTEAAGEIEEKYLFRVSDRNPFHQFFGVYS